MTSRNESGFKHLLRVRIGANGPTGRLLHIEKKDKSGWYWKVKLDSGEWVWPADLVQDGPGDCVGRCQDCGMRFLSQQPEPLCPSCSEAAFGTAQRAKEPNDYVGTRWRGPARH
jgi:hypothetical protein